MAQNLQAAFGIDLGTTNSCIARYDGKTFRPIVIDGFPTVPSVVAWHQGAWLVGRRALTIAQLNPRSVARSIKRQMGDASCRISLGNQEFSPTEISAKILAYLKTEAEKELGEKIEDVVITVPAWFNDPQRRATLEAGKLAGLNVLRMINEPTAAALAFDTVAIARSTLGQKSPHSLSQSERWLVFDLGGGTFDVTVLNVQGHLKEVMASCGDTFLGGDDFDYKIALQFAADLHQKYQIQVAENSVSMAVLRTIAEAAKINLSQATSVAVHEMVPYDDQVLELKTTITREAFVTLIHPYLANTIAKTREVLQQAKLVAADINRVFLVGGSTRIPAIAEQIYSEFSQHPEGYVDPDLSVALGAAVQSGLDLGLSLSQIMIDVTPHSLGIAALGEYDNAEQLMFRSHIEQRFPRTFVPIIRKNTRIPARAVESFFTMMDNQSRIDIAVFQGESSITYQNTLIGSFTVPLPSMPAHSVVDISFSYDISGMIHVDVAKHDSQNILKTFAMNVNRSVSANSDSTSLKRQAVDNLDDLSTLEYGFADAKEESPDPSMQLSKISNFLIEKVTLKIAGSNNSTELDDIKNTLSKYQLKLADGIDDVDLDALEDKLYSWLDSQTNNNTTKRNLGGNNEILT